MIKEKRAHGYIIDKVIMINTSCATEKAFVTDANGIFTADIHEVFDTNKATRQGRHL